MTETKEHPTPKLRFVSRWDQVSTARGPEIREGRILQQEWEIVELDDRGIALGFRFEWRDVPLEVDA